MPIRVRYFASLKEILGRDEDSLPPFTAATPRLVWQTANPGRALPGRVLTAINLDYADLDSPVQDGDEVAFFPPVTGG